MFRLARNYFGTKPLVGSTARRKNDSHDACAEAEVLKALHLMARRSSPHKAAARASMARAISVIEASMLGLYHIEELVNEWVSVKL